MIPGADLDHVALAVERHDQVWPRYIGELGGRWAGGGESAGFAWAQVAFADGMRTEALRPHRPEQNDFLRRFLDHTGPGPHHLTFKVASLAEALDQVEEAGYRPVGVDTSDPGWLEAFIHPKDGPGVVVQLAESHEEGSDSLAPGPDRWQPPEGPPARLVHVAHAVASLDDARTLFVELLGGREVAQGRSAGCRWVRLAWPGPGRLVLVSPTGQAGPWAEWLGGRPGRVHHLAFSLGDPGSVTGARPRSPGWVVPPPANHGTRLVLAGVEDDLYDPDPFA